MPYHTFHSPQPSRPLHVLVIDDDPAELELARFAFEEQTQPHQLSMHTGGEAAFSFMREAAELPDLILLDLNMPGMNGLDVLGALKAEPAWQHIPVVMLTNSDDEADIQRAYTGRACAYMVKAPSLPSQVEQCAGLLAFWTRTRLIHWPN